MFSRHLRILLNIHKELSRRKFHSVAITRQVNLKTISRNQQKALTNLNEINTASSAVYQSGKYSNLPSENREYESDPESDNEDAKGLEKKDGFVVKVTENKHAYNILKNSSKVNTIIPPLTPDEDIPEDVVAKILEKNHEDSSPAEVLEDFRLLSFHCGREKTEVLTPKKHSSILQTLKKYLTDFSDQELWSLLQYIELWYPMAFSTKMPLLTELEEAIDKECLQRMNVWSIDEWLKTCDLLFRLRQVRQSHFISRCIKKMSLKTGKLTAGNFLHYMFLFNIARKPDINMYELEYRLEKFVDQFTADELGVISMGFFKTQTPIRNTALLDKILNTATRDIDQVREISLAAIMKITRFSMGLNTLGKFRKLMYAFQPRIQSASTTCLVHTAHAAATVLAYEKEVINEIFDRFLTCIPEARIKDLERMLFSLIIFNYPKESLHYKLIVEELRNPVRTKEIKKFSKCLATSLMYLSHANVYPLDIIEKVMNPQYLKEVYNNNAFKIGREYLIVDMGLKIEVPEYKGPVLPERVVNYLSKRYSATVNFDDPTGKLTCFQRFVTEFIHLLKEIIGSKDMIVEQLLPHHQRADIVICLDKENNIVPPSPYFPKLDYSSIKYAPKEPADCTWHAFVLVSHNHLFRSTVEPCGTLNSKIRQLKAIGYNSILVPHTTWHNTMKTLEERKKYVQQLLLEHDINTKSIS